MLPEPSLIAGLLLVLSSAFLGGLLARKFSQPLMFGYLFAGLIASSLIPWLGLERKALGPLSEIGVSFLMFALGLEFSLKQLEKEKKTIVFGAVFQIIITTLLGIFLFAGVFKFDQRTATIMAGAFSLSSTAIVVKLLQERNQLESLSGEIMVGWLLLQDLAVLPMIGLLPVLAGGEKIESSLIIVFKAILILAGTWILLWKVIPKLTDLVVLFKSRELLLLFAVAFVFLFSLLTANLGFSYALGAFLAGLILGQAEAHFAIFSEIRPLRDVFLAIFFVSLGLSLEVGFWWENFGKILLLGLSILTLKVLLILGILAYLGYHAKTIFSVSFGLAEVGEFSFILAMIAFLRGFLSSASYSLIVSVTLLTMVLTPSLFFLADKLYCQASIFLKRFPRLYRRFFVQSDSFYWHEELSLADHVVVLGYGRVGKWVGNILEKAGLSYLVVEYNPRIVRQLKHEGKRVVFGDPTDLDVLDFAQVDRARLIVLAIPDLIAQKMIVTNIRALNPTVEIVCRSHEQDGREDLKKMGVTFVIHPEFEAALSIGHRVLQSCAFAKEEINKKIKEVRRESIT